MDNTECNLKVCPITMQYCREDCAWYLEEYELCAIVTLVAIEEESI